MTAREMQVAFEREANFQDPIVKPTSTEIFYWINKAIDTFVKNRYTGNNPKREGFEQTQKRIDDIRTLVTEASINTSVGTIKPNSYTATIPSGYLFTLGEEATISYTRNGSTETARKGILETTTDRYRDDVDNPFSEHILFNYEAKPLRLYRGAIVELISDGTYTIPTYHLRYLTSPTVVALPSTSCNLPEHTHYEVVKIATKMYLERTKDPRQQTYNNEIVTME
jgi:hypothetical protein